MGAQRHDERDDTIIDITSTANTALTEVKATSRPMEAMEEADRARSQSKTDPSLTHMSAQAEAERAKVRLLRLRARK